MKTSQMTCISTLAFELLPSVKKTVKQVLDPFNWRNYLPVETSNPDRIANIQKFISVISVYLSQYFLVPIFF